MDMQAFNLIFALMKVNILQLINYVCNHDFIFHYIILSIFFTI